MSVTTTFRPETPTRSSTQPQPFNSSPPSSSPPSRPQSRQHQTSNGGPPTQASSSSRLPSTQERPLSMASFRSGIYEGEPDSGRRRKKPRAPTETLIFVRPPISSKVAMNIQCQLVVHPTGGARTASESTFSGTRGARSHSTASTIAPVFTASPHQSTTSLNDPSLEPEPAYGEDRGGLEVIGDAGMERQVSRSPSMRSTTSATSQGTVASTASGSTTKRITPLWNLNHHTVMTTYVSDAGTDAKLVKFLKRGIAVHRLGFLEPYEHWPSVISSPSSTNPSPSSKFIPLPTEVNLGRPSLDQVFSRQSILSAASSEATAVNGEDHAGPKKLFGRFFGGSKKKESGGGTSSDFSSFFKPSGSVGSLFASKENVQPPPHSPSGASAASVTPTSSPSKSFAALGVPGSPSPSNGSVAAPSVNIAQVDSIHGPLPYLGYPTLGTQPIVRPLPVNEKSPGSRPAAYIWVVTKWTAGDDGWTFAGLSDALSIGAGVQQAQNGTTTVRFEWIRGRTGKRPTNPRRASGAGSPVPGSSAAFKSNNGALQPSVGGQLPPSSLGPGLSSPNLSRTSLALSNTGASENNIRMSFESRNGGGTETEPSSTHETDADEEVDPEDSEVPWMCYVVRSPPSGPSERSLIGTLSPAPHHPKVLAQLKTPFPLNPFPLPGVNEMPFLSPQQLKEVLCATALFLLVREEWGGIGKKKKDASSAGKR